MPRRPRLWPVIVAIGPTLGVLACCTPPPPSLWNPAPALPVRGVAAHRGGGASHPENTLSAFRAAVGAGAAQIELDVRGTADHQLVVIHDSTVDRTTDGHGSVSRLTLAEIRALDAGSWKAPEFAGERIPTLAEVLDAMPRDRWLNVNIKDDPWVAVEAAHLLAERDMLGQSFLAVGEAGARAALTAVPGAATCYLDRKITRAGYIRATLRFGAQFIQLHHLRGRPTPAELEALHAAGVRVDFCCVDTVSDARELLELGVDFPLVDDVDAGAADLLERPP